MSDIDARALWAEVQANSRRLRNCDRHRFPHVETWPKGALGDDRKITCSRCNGWMDRVYIPTYLAGYRAAGGDVTDVVPGWSGSV